MEIDEQFLQQLLASQEAGMGFVPTPEMMMMNAANANESDGIDPMLLNLIQQQQQQQQQAALRANSSVIVSSSADIDDNLLIEDETLLERIVALKEMFPESVRTVAGKFSRAVMGTSKFAVSKGRMASWWLASSLCVLVFPILVQKELLQIAEQLSREQRSILLGPQAVTGAFGGGSL